MTLPDDIYSQQLLELAAAMPRTERLISPQATAKAHSKLCGSRVEIDLVMDGDVVTDYGQTVRACLLGQTAASIMGREIVGSTAAELRAVGATMRKMLKEGGPPPTGKWADLGAVGAGSRLQGPACLDPARVRRGRGRHGPDRGQAGGRRRRDGVLGSRWRT